MQKALEKFGEDALADAIGVATIGVPCAVEKDLLLATPEQKMRAVVSLIILWATRPLSDSHPPFKKYIIMAYDYHYPAGGLKDIVTSCDDLVEAVKHAVTWVCGDEKEIIDRDTWEIVWTTHPHGGSER